MPDDIKEPSGFQKRSAQEAKESKAELREIKRRLGMTPLIDTVKDFAAVPTPDVEDDLDDLRYARRLIGVALTQIAHDPSLESEKRWHLIGELSDKLSKLHTKALTEHKIKTVVDSDKARRRPSGGATPPRDPSAGPAPAGPSPSTPPVVMNGIARSSVARALRGRNR